MLIEHPNFLGINKRQNFTSTKFSHSKNRCLGPEPNVEHKQNESSVEVCQRRSKNLPDGGVKVGHCSGGLCRRERRKSRPVCRELSGSQSGFALGKTVAIAVHL